MKLFLRSICISSIALSTLNAVMIYEGNTPNDPTITFATALNSCVYHTPTQTLYIGLDQTSANYSLCKIATTQGNCTALASTTGDNPMSNTFINNLTLAASSTAPEIPFIVGTSAADQNTATTKVFVANYNGSKITVSSDLNDAGGTTTTAKIVNLAASDSYIFAPVITNGVTTSFGTGASDGIALIKIDKNTQALTLYNAVTGQVGNQALGIADDTTQITADSDNVTFAAAYTPALCWNEKLKRLYIGLQGNSAALGKMISVLIAKVDPETNILSLLTPVGNYDVIEDDTRIIGTTGNNSITANKLAVMETSTGFFYLIVQGGNNTAANTNNRVYAVPLVSGEVDDTILGTFAYADLTSDDFTIQAAQNDDLFQNTEGAAVVGSTTYHGEAIKVSTSPIANNTDRGISSLFVCGDTVYISIASEDGSSANNAPGIYYSQAIFNHKGKIQSWTAWTKAAPFESGVSDTDGSSQYIFVNAITGHIISVDQSKTIVKSTEWRTIDPDNDNALLNKLNETFSNGCFSCCDLHQNTANLGENTTHRYALFGSKGTVAIARISTGQTSDYGVCETVVTDFSSEQNFKVTTLPNDDAPVTCLGYSKWAPASTRGFLFAGTKNGLYVYATNTNTGVGFNSATLTTLDETPFAGTFSWQKVTSITGEVRAIKSINGSSVYILTKDLDANGVPVDKVFQITLSTSLADLIANTDTVATCNTGNLTGAYLFFDIDLIPVASDASNFYMILATSDGLYKTGQEIDLRTNQTDANWAKVTDVVTDKIFATHNTLYPFSTILATWKRSNPQIRGYDKALIHQLSSALGTTDLTELPVDSYITNQEKPTMLSSISNLFSDGTRRFMIQQSPDGKSTELCSLPYNNNTLAWNYPYAPYKLTDSLFTSSSSEKYYWIQTIGATGNIYVGTSNGVIALG